MTQNIENRIIACCINKLSELFKIPVSLLKAQLLGGGCINRAIKIDTSAGEFFLKWNPNAPADMFYKEAEGLRELASVDDLILSIPKVIWQKEADELPAVLLMEYLPAGDIKDSDERLGCGLAQIHKKTATSFGFYHTNYCGTTIQLNNWTSNWSEFFAKQRIEALLIQLKSFGKISVQEILLLEKLIEKMPNLLPNSTVPSLIQGILLSGNYLKKKNGPALIDPACYYADREMEMAMMKLFGGFSGTVWSAYNDEFPLPDDWHERIELYQLYHILNHFLMFGESYKYQALTIVNKYIR